MKGIFKNSFTGIMIMVVVMSLNGFTGCDLTKDAPPVPEPVKERAALDFTQADVDALVSMTQEKIFLPAPTDNGDPPEECDYVHFLRFKLKDIDYDPEVPSTMNNVDAFLLVVPGILEGANGFEYFARNLIYTAKVYNNLNLEVYAMDRRANCLEDTSAEPYIEQIYYDGTYNGQTFETMDEKHDAIVDLALGYYYYGETLPNGKKFAGFLKNKDVPYLSDFGLKMNTESMFKIAMTMVPDLEARQKKLFVGGHSMGGMHTAVFAGWDLDGDLATLDDAGYMNCAGLYALDSSVAAYETIRDPLTSELPISTIALLDAMDEYTYLQIVDAIRKEWLPPLLPFPFFDAEVMATTEMIGYLGDWFPDHEATALDEIPMSSNLKATLQVLHSRTLSQFINAKPTIKDFRYTNEALIGAFFDDNFVPVGMIQTSMGFLKGGPVVQKDFPLPSDFSKANPELADSMGMMVSSKNMFIPADEGAVDKEGNGPLYSWADFDEIGNAEEPDFQDVFGNMTYTTMENEISDIHDFARALHQGPSNLVEWYFPLRPVIDMNTIGASWAHKYGMNYFYGDMAGQMPMIELVQAKEGVSDTDVRRQIKGANHMDPMFMSANTSSHRENEVMQPLIDFIIENKGE
ncbi:MAG: hypothetical protein KJ737_17405 [Proteobacteria bacterium]|nr:hypothetical protein [Pseudomonadota bacterium]